MLCLILGLSLLAGCGGGGGGGGGGGSPVGPTPTGEVPGTDALVTPGNVVQHQLVAGQNIFSLPTPAGQGKFGLTISNVGADSANPTVSLKPLSSVTGPFGGGSRRALANQVQQALTEKDAPPPPRLPANQAWIDQQMRQRGRRAGSIRAPGLYRNLRAAAGQPPTFADHRNEALGDTVTLWVYARSTLNIGTEYLLRNAVLRRIGAHCKIFVDPDSFNGLSAVTGPYAITEAQLDGMMADFDTIGWPLIVNGYGTPWDIDQDGKVSLFFSPLLAKNGFAGLFDTKHFEQVNEDGTPNDKTNNRDMVAIWSPGLSADWVGEHWLAATRETCIHEFQHLVNYSIHCARNGWPTFLGDAQQEEVWLDEALSTGAEARFRILRGDPAGEDRFNSYSSSSPAGSGLMNFAWNLASYGHIGMFSLYMWEQGGDEAIRAIVQNSLRGRASIDQVFAARGGLIGMYRDWGLAVLAEGLRQQGALNPQNLPARYRFAHDLDLNLALKPLSFGAAGEATVTTFGTEYFLLSPPTGFAQSSYRLLVEGPVGMTVSVTRLP